MTNTNRTHVAHGHLVAGAAAEGYGVLVGWSGSGALTRADLATLAASAGLPADWLPAPKEPGVQLSRAVQSARGGEYNAEQVKKSTWRVEVEPREWASRWMLIARAIGGAPVAGASFGTIALVATLYTDTATPDLVLEAQDEALATLVRTDYEDRIGGEIYNASDVTAWLGEVLQDRLTAVRYGGNWYVPRAARQIAESVTAAFSADWGRNWMVPPLPCADTDQLALGVANGLIAECGEVAAAMQKAKESAKVEGRDLGERAAQSLMGRLRYVAERVAKYATLLGDSAATCRDAIHDAMVELDGVLGAHDFTREWAAAEVAAKRAEPVTVAAN